MTYSDLSFNCYQMADVRQLEFLLIQFLIAGTVFRVNMHRVPNVAPISQAVADICFFRYFKMGSHPPSWICCTPAWTTHEA